MTVPKMFEGRVIIVTGANAYNSVAIGKYCSLHDKWDATFNPANYELLETEAYDCIIDAKGNSLSNRRTVRVRDHINRYLPIPYCTGMPWACGCPLCDKS